MLQGAIIGAIVGTIVTFIMIRKRAQAAKSVFAAYKSRGLEEARVKLDKWAPPVTGKVRLSKLPDTMERMAALALIGDLGALEREVEAVEGALTAAVQVRAIGLVGLATEGADAPRWAEQLEQAAVHVETEGGAMLKVVKRNIRGLADVAKELAGTGSPSAETKLALVSYASKMGAFTKPLLFKFLAAATEMSGGDPAEYTARFKAASPHL